MTPAIPSQFPRWSDIGLLLTLTLFLFFLLVPFNPFLALIVGAPPALYVARRRVLEHREALGAISILKFAAAATAAILLALGLISLVLDKLIYLSSPSVIERSFEFLGFLGELMLGLFILMFIPIWCATLLGNWLGILLIKRERSK